MSSLVTSLRGWWRPRHVYLPLPNSVRSPNNTTLSMYSKLDNNYNGKSPGRDANDSSNSSGSASAVGRGRSYTTILLFSLFFNAIMVYFTFYALSSPVTPPVTPPPPVSSAASDVCPAPLPNLFSADPPSTGQHPQLREAVESFRLELHKYYEAKRKTAELDSVAIAVVTPQGSLVEAFHGPLKANDTSSNRQVDRNSIYRIASVSKLFTALETFILRDKGALNLDDPVSKYIKEMRSSKSPNAHALGSITIRQLLSHMSGIGRDWPPGDATHHWPKTLKGKGPPPYSGVPIPNRAVLLDALDDNAWVTEPYKYPVYSNTGYALLGLVNRIADKKHEGPRELSHAELLERDIFDPLGFTGSTFLITDKYKHNAAVSAVEPNETFFDFGATNPAVGQLSCLSDFVLLAKALLNPSEENAPLPPVVMREWLRPLHNEWDGYTAVGMPWEIYRHKYSTDKNSNIKNRTISLYQKLGDVMSHQAGVTLLPTRSAAIVILTTGKISLVGDITKLAIKEFMPAFDGILAEEVEKHLGGRWTSTDKSTTIELEVDDGSLYATEYKINGTDALETLQGKRTKKMALWSVGNDEYRLSPSVSSDDGCAPHWIGLDAFPYANGSPVNLLRLHKHSIDNPKDNILNIPSMELNLTRLE